MKKCTTLELNLIRYIISNLHYNFLSLSELEIFLKFLSYSLEKNYSKISFFQKKEISFLIEKLSIRNTLSKSDKKLIFLLLFIDKKKTKKKLDNNLNSILQSLIFSKNQLKNDNRMFLIKYSLFFSFLLQMILIKGSAI